jgi:hypothetical protein
MEDASGDATVHFRLCHFKRFAGSGLITGGDS